MANYANWFTTSSMLSRAPLATMRNHPKYVTFLITSLITSPVTFLKSFLSVTVV